MNQSSIAQGSTASVTTLKKSESIRISELERAIRINSLVRVVMDSVVVLVMLMFGQGAKTAFQSMVESNQQTIQVAIEAKQGIDQISAWIEKHRKDEEAMISQAEMLSRQLKQVKP